MIQNQAELEFKLSKVAELQAELATRRDRFQGSPDAIAFTASYESILRELLQEIQDYAGVSSLEADYQFHFKGKKAGSQSVRITEIQDFFGELQTNLWLAAERVLDLNPRQSGPPNRRVSDNCSLTIAFALPGSLRLGFNYIADSMFPDVELQDRTAEYFAAATEIAASEDLIRAQNSKIDVQFLNHLASLGRISDAFSSESQSLYRGNALKLQLNRKMATGAEQLVTRYKSSKPFEGQVHVGILNFYTGRYQVLVEGRTVPLYYEPDVISKELAEQAANKMLNVKGTLYLDETGRIERLVVSEAELAL